MKEMTINGALLKEMFLTGAALLEKNKALIDSLNVFPVPDGDTGTNMSMTMQSAVREIKSSACDTVGEVAAAASLGSLKGARGNSGVILSQIFRGFARALDGKDEMDAAMLAVALKTGTEAAYKAVMKPKEGTMLTVSRMISERVGQASAEGANVYKLVDIIIEEGEAALKITPDLLPVLKEAGVVDSGGKGLLTIFRGFKMALDGEEVDDLPTEELESSSSEDNLTLDDVNDITYGYCTEFFIIHLADNFSEADLDKFREKLMKIGDSVVVAHDTGFVKVHVHSNAPGKILQLALRLGELDKLKIENMREQNREIQAKLKETEKECAMVAVSTGAGIDAVFTELGVEGLIQGGQTMNPSTEDMLKAIDEVNAKNIFIFPNNKNIILAANQARDLTEDKNIVVIPAKTIPQGISAMIAYVPEKTVEENTAEMMEAIENVKTGQVTYAVRDTRIDDQDIHEGDIMGIGDKGILAVGQDIQDVAVEMTGKMTDEDSELISIYYGAEVTEADAEEVSSRLEELYPDYDIEINYGGQPIYYYVISVE